MRNFTEKDVENYLEYVYENMFDKEQYEVEIKGRCHMCGVPLNETKTAEGLVSEFCCADCVEGFVEQFEELESENFYK